MMSDAQLTVIEALAGPPPSLPLVTEAVLGISPQLWALVVTIRCTCTEAPEARVPWLQVSLPPEIEQPTALVPAPSIAKPEVPVTVGRVSVMVTPVAVPAPVLVTPMTKPI